MATHTRSICSVQGTQQPRLGKCSGRSGSSSVSAKKTRVQKWLEETNKQRQRCQREKTTAKQVTEVKEPQKDKNIAPGEEETSTSVLSFCLFTRTRLSPPTSSTWAFPSSTSSIIPLHPSKSPCFIPTNCTPWPTSRSPTVSCDPAPAVVSLATPPAFLGCFSLFRSLPSDAPLVSVVFSLL